MDTSPARPRIIAFSGPAGSGKDTAANILCDHYGYSRVSFAASLKDAIAAIFKWSREDLDGLTVAARQWREQLDPWWTARLGFPVSPRLMLQQWGTDLARNQFHSDIWVASLERELIQADRPVVITDCRFENEATIIRRLGGTVVHICGRNGAGAGAAAAGAGAAAAGAAAAAAGAAKHISEALIHIGPSDITIHNNTTLADFTDNVRTFMNDYTSNVSRYHYP